MSHSRQSYQFITVRPGNGHSKSTRSSHSRHWPRHSITALSLCLRPPPITESRKVLCEERLSLVFRLLHHPMALLVPRSPLLVQHNDRPLVSATVAINCPAAPKNMFPPPRPLQNAPKGESNPPATEEMVRSPDCLRPLAAPPSPRALCPKKA